MIELYRNTKPSEMTEEWRVEKTEEFKLTGKRVWNVKFLKTALVNISGRKCAYCECRVNEEGSFFEVEHYRPKELYKDEVLKWENLLPSCKRCNGRKDEYDTQNLPFINPCEINPRTHFQLKPGYYIVGASPEGVIVEDKLKLNDLLRMRKPKARIMRELENSMTDIYDELQNSQSLSEPRKDFIANKLSDLMAKGLPENNYSAIRSHVILNHSSYHPIKEEFQQIGIWSDHLEKLESELKGIAFDKWVKPS